MGLFDIFKKKDAIPPSKDLIWKSKNAKFKACINLVQQNQDSIWISWFSETQKDFQAYLETANISVRDLKMARNVQAYMVENKNVFFLEHYPLLREEENLIKSWNAKGITFLSSLDEPIFHQFGGDKIIGLMEKLGMTEDESMEHSMISRALKNAQEKLQEKVSFESQANSSKDWFRLNISQV